MSELLLDQYHHNKELDPNWFDLQRMEKNGRETFKEYAQR